MTEAIINNSIYAFGIYIVIKIFYRGYLPLLSIIVGICSLFPLPLFPERDFYILLQLLVCVLVLVEALNYIMSILNRGSWK